jgi:hypothetical protein
MRRIRVAVALLLLAFSAQVANAEWWTVTPYLAGGTQTSVNINPGDNFTVDFRVTRSDTGTSPVSTGILQSAVFDVNFSVGGLQYTGYTWQSPFTQGVGSFDGSSPNVYPDNAVPPAAFPVTVSAGSTSAYLANMTLTGFTLPGTVVSLNFHVPTGFTSNTVITPIPDTFTDSNGLGSDSGDNFFTYSGGSFAVISNVPEPSTVAMLVTGGAAALGCVVVRRRRQRAALTSPLRSA